MTPTWEQIRGRNYGTIGRTVSGIVHYSEGSFHHVRYAPDSSWRMENEAGEPTFIEGPGDRWSRDADGEMVHAVKSPDTFHMYMGSPALIMCAYQNFPPVLGNGAADQRFSNPTAPQSVTVRGRDGWEVSASDPYTSETVTFVFDAELGVALRWHHGDRWMELENPSLDDVFEPDMFRWSGPSRPAEDEMAKFERERQEKERALAGIPQAVPTWLPVAITATSKAGDPRTGELDVAIAGQTPYFTLRRWVSALREPEVAWPGDQTPSRHRQTVGAWSYEIRSYQEMDQSDCARIIDSIVPVDTPERDVADISAEIAADEADRREQEVLAILGTGRVLADHLSGESLLIRTDFSDDAAWREIALAAMSPVPQGDEMEFEAVLTCIDNRDYDGLTVDSLLDAIGEPPPYYAFVVDADTVANRERPILVIDAGPDDRRGNTFRVVPGEMWSVENNLSLANMDFEDFSGSADEDGVFRGFGG